MTVPTGCADDGSPVTVDALLSMTEVTQRTGLAKTTVHHHVHRGNLKTIKLRDGRKRYTSEPWLAEFMTMKALHPRWRPNDQQS